MDDVADAFGITRLIVYRHFESKEELYRAVLERVMVRLRDEFLAGYERSTDRDFVVRALLVVAHDDPDGFRLLWVHAAHEPRFADYAAGFRDRVVGIADEFIGPLLGDVSIRRWATITFVDHLYDTMLTSARCR